MFLQLLRSVKSLSALQTPDLIRCYVSLLVAPAACVLFVLLEVLLTEKLPQTSHAVNPFGFTFMLAVQLSQAEVAAASNAGVRQQTKMGEAMFEESVLLGESLRAVCAFKIAMATFLPVAREGFRRGKIAATHVAHDIHHAFV